MFVNCIFPAKYFAAFMIVTEADSVAASSMSLRMLWTDCECEHWHCEHTRQPPPRPAACWPVSGNTCASQPPLEGTLRHSLGVWIVENKRSAGLPCSAMVVTHSHSGSDGGAIILGKADYIVVSSSFQWCYCLKTHKCCDCLTDALTCWLIGLAIYFLMCDKLTSLSVNTQAAETHELSSHTMDSKWWW